MTSMGDMDESQASIRDTFRILVATDIHLGFAENDPERRDDSFNTFEEILQLAKAHEVDFILLGGDLFHENKPSSYSLHQCVTLLRKYCLGDKPVEIEFLSDQSKNFEHCTQSIVNYDDPNLNVSIPVFSIHGNHDDPNGYRQLSSLDILSTAGLVNYFGKWTDLKEVKIVPILLQKGQSKLALYGLSHIKDERLARLFREKNVHMYTPSEYADEWYNIFVCHQNRVERGHTKYVSEHVLPSFLDLVIWGHEHECRITPESNSTQRLRVTQPGSSVATSLCEAEAREKHVGLLEVCKRKFKLTPLKLQTVRPFIFKSLNLSECQLPSADSTTNSVQKYLEDRLEFWLEEAALQRTGHRMQPEIPLIRIRVTYNDEAQTFNVIRFGQKFQSKVANAIDMILLKKDKPERKARDGVFHEEDKENMAEFLQNEEMNDMWEVKMNLLMQKYFDEVATKKLQIFSVKGISDAAARFVDKSDRESIKAIIEHQMDKIERHLCQKKVNVDEIDNEIENYRQERIQNSSTEAAEFRNIMENVIRPPKPPKPETRISDSDDSDHQDEEQPAPRGRARGTRGGRGSRAGQGRAMPTTSRSMSDNSDDEDEEQPASSGRARGTRGGRGSRAGQGRAMPTTSRARGRGRGSQSSSRASSTISSSSRSSRQTTLDNHLKYADSENSDTD